VIQPEILKKVKDFAEDYDLKFHLDGARIFNAAVATKKAVTEFSKYTDSIMFCLSKGLSCPVGSLVAGSKDFISKARKYRKILGGGMRQAGIIAAFGLEALEPKWIHRLEEDHKNAKLLAKGLSDLNLLTEVPNPDTNILIITFPQNIRIMKIISKLNKEGILAFNIDDRRIRFVTHYGLSEDDILYAISKITNILKETF
jgi:threonine aldolase